MPFETVDEVLAGTVSGRRRARLSPARVVVCPLLATGLFGELGCRQVWDRLRAGLGDLALIRQALR